MIILEIINNNPLLVFLSGTLTWAVLTWVFKKLKQVKADYDKRKSLLKSSGIMAVYENKNQECIDQMYQDAKNSKKIRVLTTLAKTFTDKPASARENMKMSKILKNLNDERRVNTRFMIFEKGCKAAIEREEEIIDDRDDFDTSIENSVKVFRKCKINYKLHDKKLRFRVYIFDKVLYLHFGLNKTCHSKSQIWRVNNKSILYKAFEQMFEDVWEVSKSPNPRKQPQTKGL